MDPHALVSLAEDLDYLKRWVEEGDIRPDEVRRGSAVLRRMFLEQEYQTAWRALDLPGHPVVYAVDFDHVVGPDGGLIQYAFAAGVTIKQVQIVSVCLYRGRELPPSPPELPNARDNQRYLFEKRFPIRDYMDSHCAAYLTDRVTRREVIRYFANLKSGVHSGRKAELKDRVLKARLQHLDGCMNLMGFCPLMAELMAIGQVLALSDDAQAFKAEVARRWPPR